MFKLTVKGIAALGEPGMYPDGGCLYLRVGPSGAKSWIARPVIHGKRREMGLGSFDLVPLAQARELATFVRKRAREGFDPIAERETAKLAAKAAGDQERVTFEIAAKQVHEKLLPAWRSTKHGVIWWQSIRDFALPHFGQKPIYLVGRPDVLKALEAIQITQPETAKRVRQRLTQIFDWARQAGHYPHENPMAGIQMALPKVKADVRHMPSLPWPELPGFMAQLALREGISARCLEWVVFTLARSGEARGARWVEVDTDAAIWTIPGARTKTGKPLRVPLAGEALAVLEKVRGLDPDLIFPSAQRGNDGSGKVMSDMVFKALIDRMGVVGITTHGFRSTFRDWASESAHAPREVAEAALGHVMGNAVERAYARSDLFDRRKPLATRWAAYATGTAGVVVPMVANG